MISFLYGSLRGFCYGGLFWCSWKSSFTILQSNASVYGFHCCQWMLYAPILFPCSSILYIESKQSECESFPFLLKKLVFYQQLGEWTYLRKMLLDSLSFLLHYNGKRRALAFMVWDKYLLESHKVNCPLFLFTFVLKIIRLKKNWNPSLWF